MAVASFLSFLPLSIGEVFWMRSYIWSNCSRPLKYWLKLIKTVKLDYFVFVMFAM